MTTATNIKVQHDNMTDDERITALYCRLSVEDVRDDSGKKKNKEDESNSISNQDGICQGVFLQKSTRSQKRYIYPQKGFILL